MSDSGSRITKPAPRCSRCGRDDVKRDGKTPRREQRYKCGHCGELMIARNVRESSGSGVIAGRIEIGRGSFWGAGRA